MKVINANTVHKHENHKHGPRILIAYNEYVRVYNVHGHKAIFAKCDLLKNGILCKIK